MFFTQEDYRKIEKWLLANSRKDTDFVGAATPLKGNEILAIVQNGQNMKVSLKDFIDQLFLLGVSDFVNITTKFGESNISLSQAIQLIPFRSRKIGQVITFLDENGEWKLFQFQGERVNQWNNTTLWVDLGDNINLGRYIFKNNLCGAPSDIGEYNDLSSVASSPFNLDTLPDNLPIGVVSTIITADSINKAPLNAEGGLLVSVHPTKGYYKGLTKQLFFPMFVRGEQPQAYLFIRKSMDNNTWSEWLYVATSSLNPTPTVGPSSSRPTTPQAGIFYFDTTLGKPIWGNGSAWVDATGTTV